MPKETKEVKSKLLTLIKVGAIAQLLFYAYTVYVPLTDYMYNTREGLEGIETLFTSMLFYIFAAANTVFISVYFLDVFKNKKQVSKTVSIIAIVLLVLTLSLIPILDMIPDISLRRNY